MADILDTLREWLTSDGKQAAAAPAQIVNRDKQKIIEIVKKLEHKHSAGIPIPEIVEEAAKIGILEETARALVSELVKDGYLSRPRWMEDMVRLHGVTDYSPWSEDFPS